MKSGIKFCVGCLLAAFGGFVTGPLRADVKVPSIFGDHMILQQDAPLPVWGIADAGEKVTVTTGTNTATTTAGADGKWRVTLSPLPSTSTPSTMTVAGKNTLTFKDVLVGEVWFASGQSNMAFGLRGSKDAATEIPQADDPQFRFFQVLATPGLEPVDTLRVGGWNAVRPANAPAYSAVAYYFGKELRAKLKRPVAIVQSAWGGTPAEAWTPIDAIKKDPALKNYSDGYDKMQAAFPQLNAQLPALTDEYKKKMDEWNKEVGVTYYPLVAAWQAEADKARLAGDLPPPKPQPSRTPPQQPPHPWGGNGTPSVLYNGEVAPVVPYAIRGVIWYQGEANASAWTEYHALLSALVTGWREHWGEGNFPFLIVQLPRFSGGGNWPQIREAQAQTQTLPDTFIANVIDVGDPNSLHPIDKADVALRLALVARHAAYDEKDLVWTGPVYDSMKVEGNTVRLNFTQTGGGLVIGSSPWVPPRSTPIPTSSLVGFAIAGDDKKWVKAEAKIDDNTVVVSSDKVTGPIAVRYAWQNAPECNLYNKEGLPAAAFRTDDWPDVSQAPVPAPPVKPPVSAQTPTSPVSGK